MGRLKTRTHPSGVVEEYVYDSYSGLPEKVKAGTTVVWDIDAMNEYGQITSAKYGTNLTATMAYDDGFPDYATIGSIYHYDYEFDKKNGWPNYRKNLKHTGLTENFIYENHRLDSIWGNSHVLGGLDYDANGNILRKSDIGLMDYENYQIRFLDALDTNLVPSALQTINYTSFEQVKDITEGDYFAEFTYNSDNQRCKMVMKQNGVVQYTRWYAGSRYMKETSGGTTTQYTWLGGDAYSAPILSVKINTGNPDIYYVLRDHLGSITHVVKSDLSTIKEYSFDAWGRRRSANDWNYTLDAGDHPLFAGRGFTGHEHLPEFNLINMNGRLYDPVVGRFLSADNYVQMPDFSQNFNRYSYALNNPLVYTDPSGEFIFTALAVLTGQLWALPITIGADFGAVTGGIRGAQDPNVGFWKGAGRGALVGGVGGGLSMIGGAGMPFVANLAIGTGSGALTGGLDAALWGNDIGEGMLWGAAAGAVFTTLTSENFSNTLKGEGFYTNENVFNNMIERGMDKQAMLDYFGFEGTYTGTTKGPSYVDGGGEGASFYGSTNPKTGSIKYGGLAFDSYDKLKMTYNKEMYHSLRVKNGIPLETQGTELGKHLKYYPEERLGFIHAYKNQGLYPSAGKGLMSNISYYQMQSFNLNPSQYYSAKWWHFIYKIPRRW
ncbi:MAG: RHS repeat-associated core domain-containing protein [Mariniphaga sp.]